MKRKIANLWYLLRGILFLSVAYLLCGVIVRGMSVGVTARDERVFAVIAGSASVLEGVAFVAAILIGSWRDDVSSSEGAEMVGLLMCFVPLFGAFMFSTLLGYGLFTSFILSFALMFGGLMLGGFALGMLRLIYEKLDSVRDEGFLTLPLEVVCLPLVLAFADILNFAYLSALWVRNTEGVELADRIDLAVAERLNDFAVFAGLVMFIVCLWRVYHEHLPGICQYPEDRKIITRMALNDKRWYVRKAAVRLLPYPQEREIIERIAQNDPDEYVREAARRKMKGGGAL